MTIQSAQAKQISDCHHQRTNTGPDGPWCVGSPWHFVEEKQNILQISLTTSVRTSQVILSISGTIVTCYHQQRKKHCFVSFKIICRNTFMSLLLWGKQDVCWGKRAVEMIIWQDWLCVGCAVSHKMKQTVLFSMDVSEQYNKSQQSK